MMEREDPRKAMGPKTKRMFSLASRNRRSEETASSFSDCDVVFVFDCVRVRVRVVVVAGIGISSELDGDASSGLELLSSTSSAAHSTADSLPVLDLVLRAV